MKKSFLLFIYSFLFIGFSHSVYSQSFLGGQIDNREGIHSITMNPANTAGTKMKVDINILSVSTYVGSDYLNINWRELSSIKEWLTFSDLSFDPKFETTPTKHNNFFGNLDILGPSVLFNIDESNSVALTTRVRSFFNLHNLGGELYKLTTEGTYDENFNFDMEDVNGIIHAWGEIGGSYSRIVLNKNRSLLKVGVTLKYLFGAGGIYGYSGEIGANYLAGLQALTTSGNLNFGYTTNGRDNDVSFSNISSGFGGDLGIVYEYHPDHMIDKSTSYRFKLGASLTDIGSIKYSKSSQYLYLLDGTIDFSKLSDSGIIELIEDNFEGTEIGNTVKIGLPTALQVYGDFVLSQKFHISAQGAISLRTNNFAPLSQITNTFLVTPRFESKWFSLFSPVGVRKYDSALNWGLGFRVGPFIMGSGSILSNLLRKYNNSVDIYGGVKIPIYKK
ncbi:DUF5723 family protein [Algoriphagus halophilus]|uniref:DUF5723 domain-containing protein n=1 Tax=Algoriphagus halophilus TaxID=226505 RepID=A0A1N6I018_9BACT|nr:DUF5723 family protein [Algoriphagus halophilus]SIO25418.1 hypothetical protein SAMN05444394_4186 [Algoriphagus halophilus]